MKVWFILVHTSLKVVGDCFAAKPSAQTPNNGGAWVYRGGIFFMEHQQGFNESLDYIQLTSLLKRCW